MPDETDFFALLKAIGEKAALFPAAANLARKAVNDIARAQLAADVTGLEEVRRIYALLGMAAFAEALDGVPAPKTKALLGRVDPHAPAIAAAPERVKALLALADGSRPPAPAAEKPAKKAASRKAAAKAPATEPPAGATQEPPAGSSPARPRRRITGRSALRVSEER